MFHTTLCVDHEYCCSTHVRYCLFVRPEEKNITTRIGTHNTAGILFESQHRKGENMEEGSRHVPWGLPDGGEIASLNRAVCGGPEGRSL